MSKPLFLLFLIIFNGLSLQCLAAWQLQPDRSSISFVSTKQSHIREVHQIEHFEANIVDDKKITIKLDLSSIESGIPIRNERMRDMLFDVTNFKYATLSLTLPQPLSDYRTTVTKSLEATMTLRGKTVKVPLEILLTPNENGVTATLLKPIIVNAAQFGLTNGVDALREIAGLTSIGYSVPVYAVVSLVKD